MPNLTLLFDTGLNDKQVDDEGLPWPTLQYSGGPAATLERDSYRETGSRRNFTDVDTGSYTYKFS